MTRSFTAGLVSATLLAVATRPWGLAFLAWVALVPAFLAMCLAAWRNRGALIAGTTGFIAAIGFTSVAYEAVLGLSLTAYVAVVLGAAVPFGLTAAAATWAVRRLGSGSALLAYPAFWCAAEVFVRQEWLLGRWSLQLSAIGYTQSGSAAVHLARFSSVTAVSLAILVVNGALATWLQGSGRHRGAFGLAVVALAVWLAWRTAPPLHTGGTPDALTRVSVLQPGLPAAARGAALHHPGVASELLAHLAELSTPAGGERQGPATPLEPALEIWPEAVWPGRLRHAGTLSAPVSPLVAGQLANRPPILLGAASHHTFTGAASNAAFTLTGTTLTHVFDKRHPVPIAEDGLARSTGPVVVSLGGVLVAPLICYDVAFPATVRAAARTGAELLAVLTDDTFAAGSDVPLQHLRVAQLRAVESGMWLAFASNGGPSALIDPAGRLAVLSGLGETVVLSAMTRLGTGSTPYLTYGDWVGVLACLASAGMAGVAGLKGGASRLPQPT